jgi:hypothetical protein
MDFNIDLDIKAVKRYIDSWSIELLKIPLPGLTLFSIYGVGIGLEPEIILHAEVDVTLAKGFAATTGMDAHASRRVITTFDTRKRDLGGGISYYFYPTVFNYNKHTPTFSNVDGTLTLRLNPELRLNLDMIGWVGVKLRPGLGIHVKTADVGNTCSSPTAVQLTVFADVLCDLEAQIALNFVAFTWKSDVFSHTFPKLGPYNVAGPFCREPPSRRQRLNTPGDDGAMDDSRSTIGEDSLTTACAGCVQAHRLTLDESVTIDTCDTSNTAVWHDEIRSQCGSAMEAAASGANGAAPTPLAAHFVLQLGVGHFHITTAPVAGGDRNATTVVQTRFESCCGATASCRTAPSDDRPQPLVTRLANETVHLVASRLDGSCGPVTVMVTRDPEPYYFVDCRVSGTIAAANATGDFASPFGSLTRALEAVAARHIAAADAGDAPFPAVITLMPDLDAGCAHTLPSGYRLPSALRNVELTLTSLRGDTIAATSLYDAHLRRCGATADRDGTASTCLTEAQFKAMAVGTAYDTRLRPPTPTSAQTDNDSSADALSPIGAGAGFALDEGESITFRGLGFDDFATGTNGGSIRAYRAVVAIENCIFSGSAAAGKGGAIYVNGGNISIEGTVALNSRAGEGGFLAVENGANLALGGSLIAHGDTTVGCGGGLFVRDSHAALAATELTGNSAETRGGGLCLEGETATAVLDGRMTFTSNDAGRYGGALAVALGAQMTSGGGMRLERNVAGLAGGAVAIMGKGSLWKDSVAEIDGNAAPAVYVLGGGRAQMAGTKVRHSSPVGISNGYLSPRPGALVCAHGSVAIDAEARLANSFDMYANPTDNVGCVDCDGCTPCEECGLCGRCTSVGCDAGYGARMCVQAFGEGALCSEASGACVPPSGSATTPLIRTTMTTNVTLPLHTTTTSSAQGGGGCKSEGSTLSAQTVGVHPSYRTATIALTVVLAVCLIVTALFVRNFSSHGRTTDFKGVGYAMMYAGGDANDEEVAASSRLLTIADESQVA